MKKYWTLPLLVIVIGIMFLMFQNYKQAAALPSDSWHREAKLGETRVRAGLDGKKTENGIRLAYFTEEALAIQTYDENLNSTETTKISIRNTKGSDVFIGGTHTIYYSDGGVYRADTEDKIAESEIFLPTEKGAVYAEGGKAVYVDGETLETTVISENVTESSSIHAYESNRGTVVSVSEREDNSLTSSIHLKRKDEVEKVDQLNVDLSPSLKMEDTYPLIQGDTATLLINAVPAFVRSSTGEKNFFLANKKNGSVSLTDVTFPDPNREGSPLQEVEDLHVYEKNGTPLLLFRAQGYTETKTGSTEAFNVFEGEVKNGSITTERLSNTPRLSVRPEMIDAGMIAWIEEGADENTLFTAASKEHTDFSAPAFSGDILLRTAGKTLTMLSTGLMTIFLTVLWYAVPLLVMVFWMSKRRNPFDEEKEWVLYVSAAIYTTVALLFDHHLFKPQLIEALPGILDFPGSPFAIILLFSLLSLLIVRFSGMDKWWGLPARVTYFVGLHVVFMTVYVGPYLF
ncbi:hypothetical protein [Salimicrobium humidisoli]|uniref:Uncharacterized protein n=1 Tax=Salimicrobium humidisoli TaxID=2029857 RepID=A0ABX4HUU6_9BACI|nr:hypothetical protein [Salimicrobium humidisoli]PBB06968.1 hypothetical protein CKW00_00490 [Salimicrobium humidisoli]